jgi:hypothetical protein
MAVFWSYLSSLYYFNTVIAGAGLPNHMMAINGRGFLGPKKKTIVSLLAFNPLWSYAESIPHRFMNIFPANQMQVQ